MILTAQDMATLSGYVSSGNRSAYYQYLQSKGDGYAGLALGVVNNNSTAGIVANTFAKQVTLQFDPTMTDAEWNSIWIDVSTGLMQADFLARQQLFNAGVSDMTLSYQQIQEYHNSVFNIEDIPVEAWTAQIVLENHADPQAWWDAQITGGGVDGIADYISLIKTMGQVQGIEWATHRDQWFNADGSVNINTAFDPDWMVANMPATFWSQSIYSPDGVKAVIEGILASLPPGTTDTLFNVGQEVSAFFTEVMSTGNDIMQHILVNGFRSFLPTFSFSVDSWLSANSYYAGEGGEFSHFWPTDGNFDLWASNLDKYKTSLQNFEHFLDAVEGVEQNYDDAWITYTNAEGIEVTMLPTLVISAADAKTDYYDWLLALIDPIVLDIGGDGISTISASKNESSFFRPSGNHGWLSGDDGFLFRDIDADGVASVQELFGSASIGGFTMLAELDTNLDGGISAADNAFSDLGVWRDFNGDGISTSDEISSLADLAIVYLDLAPQDGYYVENGNVVTDIAFFERSDGSRSTMADVWFQYA